ncbi:Tat pathway signal protein [uncultured Litoreibacter sp.]|uniref:Tat pathway signal protein n=1 Tax=uncultured Litoreibacter sp. TaxID=1392394 RepID=UPI0026022742|nr:Tat pathway signal protein [uncultured Litoreibacter sp.]
MTQLTRRGFMAATLATGASRAVPVAIQARKPRVILELVYDKALGMMRAVERVVR